MLKTIVSRYKLLTYTEFVNLNDWELEFVIGMVDEAEREEWERARFVSYIIAQTQSTKKMKPSDILKFPWDGKSIEKTTTTKQQFEDYKKKIGM